MPDPLFTAQFIEHVKLVVQQHHLLYPRIPPQGIFAEPASAACVAGLLKYAAHPVAKGDSPGREPVEGRESKGLAGKTVVCVITGHGLKDPDTALTVEAEMTDVPADTDAVVRAMGLD